MRQIFIVVICCAALLLTGCAGFMSEFRDAFGGTPAAPPARVPPPAPQPTAAPASPDAPAAAVPPAPPPATDAPGEPDAPVPTPPSNYPTFPFQFTAQDLYGNTVTEADLGDKEVFFVHYWATWCPPCIAEMPEIGQIVEQYSDRVGFIGLLDDYDTSRDIAVQIKESSNAMFLNVDAYNPDLRDLVMMAQSGYVPTTVIIDRNGNMIGDQIIGAFGLGYATFLDAALGR